MVLVWKFWSSLADSTSRIASASLRRQCPIWKPSIQILKKQVLGKRDRSDTALQWDMVTLEIGMSCGDVIRTKKLTLVRGWTCFQAWAAARIRSCWAGIWTGQLETRTSKNRTWSGPLNQLWAIRLDRKLPEIIWRGTGNFWKTGILYAEINPEFWSHICIFYLRFGPTSKLLRDIVKLLVSRVNLVKNKNEVKIKFSRF